MKKIIFLILFIFVLCNNFLFANEYYNIKFEERENKVTKLNFEVEKYSFSEINKNGTKFTKIEFGSGVHTKKKGFAKLPIIHASVSLYNNKNISYQIIDSNFVDYKLDNPLLPSKGTIYRYQNPTEIPYRISEKSLTDRFFPQQIIETSDPFILRDFRGINIYAHPFRYNAKKQIVRIYKSLTLKIKENSTKPINPLQNRAENITPEMNNIYRSVFINYQPDRFVNEIGEFGSLLAIYTDRDSAAISPFIEWKKEKGFTVYTESVNTGTNVASLVENRYNSHNDILYVQLVGDWADVMGPTSGGNPTDPNLGCVAGSDVYPDLIVGRISANSSNDVEIQVNKFINYEKYPNATGNWYKSTAGVASNQGPGDDNEYDYEHMNIIWNDKLDPFTYDNFTPIYDPVANVTMVADAVNNGVSVVNYCGHGSTYSWGSSGFSNSDINNLSNGDKLPFIISVACWNGNFDGNNCFAEAWLKKDNGGAVGMLASTISQAWEPPMRGQDYIMDMLIGGYNYDNHDVQYGINTDVQKTTMGATCFNGTILMTMEDMSSGQPEMQCWTYFGDPTCQIITDTPGEITLSNETVTVGMDFCTTVRSYGVPIRDAMVSLYQDGENYSAVTDSIGSVSISHSLEAGLAKLTVTAFNLETIYQNITVEESQILPPENVKLNPINDSLRLSWDEVPNATYYDIYFSQSPDSSFSIIETGQFPQIGMQYYWDFEPEVDKGYYFIKACNNE